MKKMEKDKQKAKINQVKLIIKPKNKKKKKEFKREKNTRYSKISKSL